MQRSLLSLRSTAKRTDQSVQSVRRKVHDPKSGFPEPVNIKNQWFFYADEVDAYIDSRPRISQKPTVKGHGHAMREAR
jgi:predicted DNA-binding transcriptional regulator AlpA